MIERRCVHCRELILGTTRARFQRNYTEHVVKEHGKPPKAPGGVRGGA